jgi:hypothetical protein
VEVEGGEKEGRRGSEKERERERRERAGSHNLLQGMPIDNLRTSH